MSNTATRERESMLSLIEFESFPKIPRLRRDMVITEKIDGTNAAVGVLGPYDRYATAGIHDYDSTTVSGDGGDYIVYAQSRKRLISPKDDNYGFARWVWDNATTLVADLGPGLHFGEWWGLGVQRGYGLDHKRFSLFNVNRWEDKYLLGTVGGFTTPNIHVVPVLKRCNFDDADIPGVLSSLKQSGSQAAIGYDRPEGIVLYHTAARAMFKVLLENDDMPKSLAA